MNAIRTSLLVLLMICSLDAPGADRSTNSAGVKLPQGMPIYGKVGAVDKQARTITLEGKEKARLFYLSPSTRVHRDKTPAKLEDVAIGQWIGGFARPDADGRPTLVSLNLAVTQRRSTATNAPASSPPKK